MLKFFGMVPKGVRSTTIETQLAAEKLTYEILGVDVTSSQLGDISSISWARCVSSGLRRSEPTGQDKSRLGLVSRSGRMKTAVAVAGPPVAAAVLGNVFIGKDSMRWFRELRAPRLQLPMAAFGAVGAAYYTQLGVVLYRAYRRDDRHVRHLALVVLVGNEVWNVAFFGRRSPRDGFLGLLLFLGPLLSLQKAVSADPVSVIALTPYTFWVIGYDVPWVYRLWRLNQG